MMTRREFLGYSAGALTLAALPLPFGAEASAEPLSLGYGLYGMKALPLSEAIDRCAEIGYRNVELTLYPGYPSEPAAMSSEARRATREHLRRLGLTTSCLKCRPDPASTPAARRSAADAITSAAQLSLELALPHPPLVAVHAGGRTTEWERLKEFILEQVGSWTAACAKLGVPLALKPHVGNSVDRPDRLLWLFERIPALKTVYDYSHFSLIDVGLEPSLHALRSRIAMIQVKDARKLPDEKHEFLLPGDGGIDYARYFKALDRIGFAGPVVVEVSAQIFNRPGYDPVVAARRSYRVLTDALRARRSG